MSDSILTGALTLSLLAGAAAAIGADLIADHKTTTTATVAVVTLPSVTVIGQRSVLVASAR